MTDLSSLSADQLAEIAVECHRADGLHLDALAELQTRANQKTERLRLENVSLRAELERLQRSHKMYERANFDNRMRAAAAEKERDEAHRELRLWLAWSNDQRPDFSPGDVISAELDGTIVLDDGITTWEPLRAIEFFCDKWKAAEGRLAKTQKALELLDTVLRKADAYRIIETGQLHTALGLGPPSEAEIAAIRDGLDAALAAVNENEAVKNFLAALTTHPEAKPWKLEETMKEAGDP